MSNILNNLLKLALKNFYPRNSMTIDKVTYPSKEDKYNEWISTSTYRNGVWSINE